MRWKGFTLSDFQVRAVEAIRAGKNVLVGAPTGAGKTLVAEYAIAEAVGRGARCIYTSPIKALSNQKFRDFRDDPDIDVGLSTGDVTIHPGARVLIMTTEILRNAIFENPASLADVAYVVFDEVHFLDDPERGAVWEETLIFAPPSIRFICLSATVANIAEIGAWIGSIREHPLEVIESARRPVPLHDVLYHPGPGVFEPARLEEVRKRARHELGGDGRGRGKDRGRRGRDRGRGRSKGRGKDRDRGRRGRDDAWRPPPIGPVLDRLEGQRLLPALVFSFSRRDCEKLAERAAGRELLDPGERARMEALQAELVGLFQLEEGILDGPLMSMTRRGIGYHHAGMLPVHKELVERMFTSGLLKLLFTTETFALGINMPARTVVFNGLKKYDGVSVDYLRTRDYLQMAGRAGRQGIDDEGLVFSLLSDQDLLEAPLARMLSGVPEPVTSRFKTSYSTLLHLVGELGRERVFEAWEKSLDAFQHEDRRPKEQDKNRRKRRRLVQAQFEVLSDLGYLDQNDKPTARGRTARLISGFEVQITELLYGGALEDLPPAALAMVFVAQIYEERRRGEGRYVPRAAYGPERYRVDRTLARLRTIELDRGVAEPAKPCDWGLTPAVLAWCEGASLDDLEDLVEVGPGDVCRTFRMAIQLLRQTRAAIDPAWDLRDGLGAAMALLNRDEIDARRQLTLG